jgi:hypothetical protein
MSGWDNASVKLIYSLCLLLCAGCMGAFGPKFRPGFSAHAFMDDAHIREKNGNYSFVWRYRTNTFIFYPESKVVDGELHFALNASTSSGNPGGYYGQVVISDPAKIEALTNNGAYWVEALDINDRGKGFRKFPIPIIQE